MRWVKATTRNVRGEQRRCSAEDWHTRAARRARSRLYATLLAAVSVALLAGSAQAGVVLTGAPASLGRIASAGRMPQPPVVYAFHWSGICATSDAPGCTFAQEELTLDPALLRVPSARIVTGIGEGVPLLPFVLFHEIGHVFDREWMTDATRASFMNLIGRTDGWMSAADGAPPAELFADAYALCSIYGATIPHDLLRPVGYGWKPTVALDTATCGIVLSAAGATSTVRRPLAS